MIDHNKRYMVITKNTYKNTVMKESQITVMEEFIDNVKVLINVLGYKVFEPFAHTESSVSNIGDELLYLSTGVASASGKVKTEVFVVFKGAVFNEKTSTKSLSAGMQKLRQKIMVSEKVQNLKNTEDILFSSSSATADCILRYSVSGPQTWKTKDGRTLKAIENSETTDENK